MKTLDLIGTAVSNTFRSKTRTLLTILAIFVGAFTLTLTNGLGTGINNYIDDTVSGVGASDVMTVTTTSETTAPLAGGDGGPAEYDPEAIASAGPGIPGQTVTALTPENLDDLTPCGHDARTQTFAERLRVALDSPLDRAEPAGDDFPILGG